MKTCRDCGKEKDAGDYYASVKHICKDCHRAAVKRRADASPDKVTEYERWRFKNDPRVKERHRIYKQSKGGKEALRRGSKAWAARNPEKRAAQIAAGNAVRDGRLHKPDRCEDCGAVTAARALQAHHADYSKPLAVEWLCTGCHRARHSSERG